ncbi:MAG: acyl-CoA/acyl-ACP dehydrogenase [Acidimicrobiia bacterium]|nr:acyl-CoA/acyl-ACP dehydrogenase [Acidimicrobiia bacterium]
MAVDVLEVDLSDEDREVVGLARRFAQEVLRPAGAALDRLPDPADVIAPGSPLWEVYDRYEETGLGDLGTADGDPVARARLAAAVSEELSAGDVGLAITLGLSRFAQPWIEMTGNAALIERFCASGTRTIGCWAVTEPDHGSDSITFSEPHFSDPALRANCIARADGDGWVISGQKAAWVSNGSIADVIVLFCTVGGERGFHGGGAFVVPADLPGVERPRPLDKLGQRSLNQGEIWFRDVRVPADHMVVGPEVYALALEGMLAHANAAMGQLFVGVARSAYELALSYAKERVQGGVPIIEHQSVKARLFHMFTQVEAARALARRVAAHNAANPPRIECSIASKVLATGTAFEVASAALQIFGGNGLSREYPIEKIFRDARASLIEDGCNEVLGLVGATKL